MGGVGAAVPPRENPPEQTQARTFAPAVLGAAALDRSGRLGCLVADSEQ